VSGIDADEPRASLFYVVQSVFPPSQPVALRSPTVKTRTLARSGFRAKEVRYYYSTSRAGGEGAATQVASHSQSSTGSPAKTCCPVATVWRSRKRHCEAVYLVVERGKIFALNERGGHEKPVRIHADRLRTPCRVGRRCKRRVLPGIRL
jgi:hypothetical protein